MPMGVDVILDIRVLMSSNIDVSMGNYATMDVIVLIALTPNDVNVPVDVDVLVDVDMPMGIDMLMPMDVDVSVGIDMPTAMDVDGYGCWMC